MMSTPLNMGVDNDITSQTKITEINNIDKLGDNTLVHIESNKEVKERESEIEEDSDGGLPGWSTVVSSFLIEFTGSGYVLAFGVYQDFYVRQYLKTSTTTQISWIGTTQVFFSSIMGLLVGPLFDKGYCYHLIITGSVIHVVSLFLLSLARPESYYQVLLAQGMGLGVGASITHLPAIAVLAHHFRQPHTRVRVMGVSVAGNSIGGLVHPIMLNYLLNGKDTIRTCFKKGVLASAGLITGLRLLAIALLRTRYPKKPEKKPEDGGRDGDCDIEDKINPKKSTEFRNMIKKLASDWPYVYFVLGYILFGIAFIFPPFYLQLDARKHGLDPTFTFYTLSILNGSSVIGRLIPGFFVQKTGLANMYIFFSLIATITLFCMFAIKTVAGVVAFATIYGFISGSSAALFGPMLAFLSEGPAEIGTRMGVCYAAGGIASLIDTPLIGALLTSRFIWWRPAVVGGCICVVGLMALIAARLALGRRMITYNGMSRKTIFGCSVI